MRTLEEIKDLCDEAFRRLAATGAMMDRNEFDEAEKVARDVIEEIEPLLPDPKAKLDHEQPWKEVISVLSFAYNRLNTVHSTHGDLADAITTALRGVDLAERVDDFKRLVGLHHNLGSAYDYMGDTPTAVEHMLKSLEIAQRNGIADMVGNIYSGLGLFSANAGDLATAEQYLKKGVEYNETDGTERNLAGAIHNLGSLYFRLGEYDTAARHFQQALAINERIENLDWASRNINNLGLIYIETGQYDDALTAFHRSLDINKRLGVPFDIELQNLAKLHTMQDASCYDEILAEKYCLQALEIREQRGVKSADSHDTLALIRRRQGRFDEAFEALQIAREVELQQAKSDTQQRIKNWHHQQELSERDARERIQRAEAEATRTLLDAVLPNSIADRMISGEERIADRYESVSILFADIVGFTTMTQHLEAEVVIRLLNALFLRFDEIVADHQCEKVKTMGDGYMVVAGAPVEMPDHQERLARVALAMQHAANDLNLREIDPALPEHIQIRIGLHCGPVICGVVGRERFVWDVYSDAVNTASRMESTGEPGRIQVSSAFAEQLLLLRSVAEKDGTVNSNSLQQPKLTERGEVSVKGKGSMTTYWLEGA